jgi:tRNA(fMet)-specific endonuclease VapC
MKYLLDTNICIHFFRGKFNLLDKISAVGIENCAISEITLAELVFGAENSANPDKNFALIDTLIDQVVILPILEAILLYGREKVRVSNAQKITSAFGLIPETSPASEKASLAPANSVFLPGSCPRYRRKTGKLFLKCY